jgi:3,4-dihydroxy 2-butanone 4-phosphate synthase/GTP cyclohydrolase II
MKQFSTLAQAIADLKSGKVIIVVDDIERENEGDFVASGAHITPEQINLMVKQGRGLVCAPVSEAKAKQVGLTAMVKKNTDDFRTAFTISIDANDTTTGISTYERALTIKTLASSNVTMQAFKTPGHIFPLISKQGGVRVRPGHTEAAIDLMALAGLPPVAVICEILDEDGTMARREQLFAYAKKNNVTMIAIAQLIAHLKEQNHG